MTQTLSDTERGLGQRQFVMPTDVLTTLAQLCDGDARKALNLIELMSDMLADGTFTTEMLIRGGAPSCRIR